MVRCAELEYNGWRLTVAPLGKAYQWWVLSPDPDHKIKRGITHTFDEAVHDAHRTLQACLGFPAPRPLLLETP